MAKNLFVAGFPFALTSDELGKLFGPSGTVVKVKILTERDTGRSRGIAFVEMSTEGEARAAIESLNGTKVGDRTIFVSEARPKENAGAYKGPERRSGKDRRANPPAARKPEERKASFGDKKPWKKKASFGEKKPWEKKSGFGEKKPWDKPWEKKDAAGGKKPWEKKDPSRSGKKWGAGGPGGGRKPGGFDRKPGGGPRGR